MSGTGTISKVSYEFECKDSDAFWRVYRMHLTESVNSCFKLILDLVTRDVDTDPDVLLGASSQLYISRDGCQRHVSGIITGADFIGFNDDQLVMRIQVEPAFRLLKQCSNSRIFQDMSVQDIVSQVLDAGLGEYARSFDFGSVSRGQSPRDYCVQYDESDYSFVCRLLEEEGINYFFDHQREPGQELLVFFDKNAQLPEAKNIDGSGAFPVIYAREHQADLESIRYIELRRTLRTTASKRSDWDWMGPSVLSSTLDDVDSRSRTRSLYRPLSRRYVSDDLDERTKDIVESHQAQTRVATGASNAINLYVGSGFELENHPLCESDGSYVLTHMSHTGYCPEEVLATSDLDVGETDTRYENSFECVPFRVPLRPLMETKKPKVYGPQTAVVSGPSGEEIHTDEHGRIKVKFHWELDGEAGPNSSCWVRVAQTWAGASWGAQFIPRLGMEVIVEFLDGNPDRPIVTGCVYNGANPVPYALPANKTQSGIKSNSSIGGGGFNEFRFEDKKGSEEIWIHGQKDWNIKILNDKDEEIDHDSTRLIGHDETHTVNNNRVKTIHGTQDETVLKDKSITVAGTHTENIAKDTSITIGMNKSETVAMMSSESVGIAKTVTVGAALSVTVGAAISTSVGAAMSTDVGGSMSSSVGGSASTTIAKDNNMTCNGSSTATIAKDSTTNIKKKSTVKVGDNITVNGGKKAVIDVKDEVTIKCGSAKIILKKNGDITISGKKINVKGSGPVAIKGSKVALN